MQMCLWTVAPHHLKTLVITKVSTAYQTDVDKPIEAIYHSPYAHMWTMASCCVVIVYTDCRIAT